MSVLRIVVLIAAVIVVAVSARHHRQRHHDAESMESDSPGTWSDFEEIARNFAKKKARQLKREVSWVDAFGRHPHMRQHPEYRQYQASAEAGEIKYEHMTHTVDRPEWTFNYWFHNDMSVAMKSKFSKVKQVDDMFYWSVEGGVKFAKDKLKKNMTFIVPPELGLQRKNYSKKFDADEVLFGAKAHKTALVFDKFNISQEIIVPPHKSVEVILSITEKESTMDWSTVVRIKGFIAVWYTRKVDGHYLWFYRVDQLVNEDPRFKKDGYDLLLPMKGKFTAVYSTAAHLNLREYDYVRKLDGKE